MTKPFRIVRNGDQDPTPEEAEWIRRVEAIMNHPENAEPTLEKVAHAYAHALIYGHQPVGQGEDNPHCGLCGYAWRPGA